MNAITEPDQILAYRMLTLLAGLRLEVRGLRMKGRSCYQIVKAEFGLTGNRRQVLEQYEAMLIDRGIKKARTE
jgi:hypothetical protein